MLDAHFKINAILNFCFFSKGHKYGKMSCHVAQIFTIECIPCAKINIFSEDCLEMMFSVGKIELKVKVGSGKKIFGAQAPLLEYLLVVGQFLPQIIKFLMLHILFISFSPKGTCFC